LLEASLSRLQHQSNAILRSGVECQLEIIGEALNKLSKVDSEAASRIAELQIIVAIRNILIYGYAAVDDALIWQALLGKLRSSLFVAVSECVIGGFE
jgi:uncharacterized protein with HEPN domain